MLIKRVSLILLVFNIMEHSHDFGQNLFPILNVYKAWVRHFKWSTKI